jgi:predicted nucleotidyltransferase
MIRDGNKLPNIILEKVSDIVEKISEDVDVVALYAYGSLAKGDLKPLSDLDFAIVTGNCHHAIY